MPIASVNNLKGVRGLRPRVSAAGRAGRAVLIVEGAVAEAEGRSHARDCPFWYKRDTFGL